jgi:hypothetical protein
MKFVEGVLQGFYRAISGLIGMYTDDFSDGSFIGQQQAVHGKNVLTRDEIARHGVLLCVKPAVVLVGIFGGRYATNN